MKRLCRVLLILASFAGCTRPTAEVGTAADEAAIRQLIQQTAAENNAADSLGWVALFEDGAVYMPPGAPEVTTREGLLEAAAAGFGAYAAAIQITPADRDRGGVGIRPNARYRQGYAPCRGRADFC